MAIYHSNVSSGSRLRGQSGAAKVAYVLRRGKYATRYDLVVSGYGNLPSWAADDPCVLFEAADLYERANGRIFVEIEVALPNELSESQQHELVRAIAAAVTAPGLPFTYSIHAGRPKSPGEPANPHAHILISERVNDGIPRTAERWFRRANRKNPGAGGAAKDRGMKEVSWVENTRKRIEVLINEHLERALVAERVTADSHATRIEKALAEGDIETAEFLCQHPPGKHLGPKLAAIERDRFRQKKGEERTLSRAGEPTDRGDHQRAIAADAERLGVKLAANSEALDRARAELQRAEQAVKAARSAGLGDNEVLRIYETSESAEAGAGWGSVEAAAAAQVERKVAAEAAAGEFAIDVEALCRSARGRGADPVSVLEEATAAFAETRAALLPDVDVWRIHDAAESAEKGTGWTAVKVAAASRQAQKETAEAGAATWGLDIEGVYAGAQAGGADPVVALEEKVAEEERLASERRAVVEQREGSVLATKQGRAWLLAAQEEVLGGFDGQLTLEQRAEIVETVYQRLHDALRERESTLRSIPEASQYLSEVVGGTERLSTLAERESVVMTAEQRLGEKLDEREERLVESVGSDELLVDAFCELYGPCGDGSSLPERFRIITLAEQWHEDARAQDAERSSAVDYEEEILRAVSSGARHLAAAQREVLGEGQDPAALDARETVVRMAMRRVEEEQDGREAALSARRCAGGTDEVDGAGLSAGKLAELEAGRRRSGDSPHPAYREQALVWAERQMDRLDVLSAAEALEPFFGKLAELGPSRPPKAVEQSLDYAEEQHREAVARRQARVAALSEDARIFFEDRLDTLDPQWRETDAPKPAYVDAAVDYAHAQVAALDEEIEGRRAVIEQTPGDGHARLLAAGFGEASRQEQVEALAIMEADLAEDFTRREERVRSDGAGEEFLERGRLEVFGTEGRQPETLPERGRVIEAAEAYQRQAVQRRRAEAERRETRHQSISDTPGGDARLGAAGWGEARTDSERDQVLAIAERDLAADFERREEALRSDETGEALLRRGRLEVLEADREAATLAERGRIIERAEALRQKAEVERRRQAAAKKRGARIEKLFAVAGGDEVFFTALDARKPAWRETGTGPADIDDALDVAEPQVERTKHQRVSVEHALIVEAEEAFPDMSRAACRQAGGKFADTATRARLVSRRLSDRAQTRSLAAERAEPPASADLVRRLFEWLRVQIEKLLDRLLPAVRKAPQVLPPVRCRPTVLPPVRRALEVLPPVRRRPEVLPPPTRQPQVLPPVQRAPEILPPVRRQPEVLMPVRQKPRVRTPQPDPITRIISRAEEQYPDVSSSTWWKVKSQLFELHETLEGQKARAAADKLSSRARRREGFRIPPPPPADPDGIEAIKKWLRECAREEIERLGLHRGPGPVPQRPASAQTPKRNARGPERTPGGGGRVLGR